MKIEIELEYVESLKQRIEQLEKREEMLENQLKNSREEEYRNKALQLAEAALNKYVQAIFQGLGFEESYSPIKVEYDPINWSDGAWWINPNAKFEIKTEISQRFAKAFISIGINRSSFADRKVNWEV